MSSLFFLMFDFPAVSLGRLYNLGVVLWRPERLCDMIPHFRIPLFLDMLLNDFRASVNIYYEKNTPGMTPA